MQPTAQAVGTISHHPGIRRGERKVSRYRLRDLHNIGSLKANVLVWEWLSNAPASLALTLFC